MYTVIFSQESLLIEVAWQSDRDRPSSGWHGVGNYGGGGGGDDDVDFPAQKSWTDSGEALWRQEESDGGTKPLGSIAENARQFLGPPAACWLFSFLPLRVRLSLRQPPL